MDRVVREVAKSQTQPNNFHFHNSSQEKKKWLIRYICSYWEKKETQYLLFTPKSQRSSGSPKRREQKKITG